MSAGTTPVMIVSGVSYTVTDVAGRPPAALTDFTGQVVSFRVGGPTGQHEVAGAGAEHDGTVRFHEKAEGGTGKDVRTWTIAPGPDGVFLATTV